MGALFSSAAGLPAHCRKMLVDMRQIPPIRQLPLDHVAKSATVLAEAGGYAMPKLVSFIFATW
ncbi:hypothetical protein [Phaeobacter sp. A36a-5a]|uniref:hypothetical protein n=1 Tax=Phaeobacter bryozoorum TaxID=1086632 RepID=UPI0035A74657